MDRYAKKHPTKLESLKETNCTSIIFTCIRFYQRKTLWSYFETGAKCMLRASRIPCLNIK